MNLLVIVHRRQNIVKMGIQLAIFNVYTIDILSKIYCGLLSINN